MPRKYKLKKRAAKQEETRQRIVDATVELHETLGPAHTTISAIAETAGVQRLTVYRHFPDEEALFRACSAQWMENNPLPNPELWEGIEDPTARLRHALREIYAYYERTEQMQANILRDATINSTIAKVEGPFIEATQRMHATLSRGWGTPAERADTVSAVLFHAMHFETWRSLVRDQGLEVETLIELMTCLVRCAVTETGVQD